MLFSSHRTLRNTVVHLVKKAPAGHTHPELQDRLRLRVYDTLHGLVEIRDIGRAEMERLYLYVSAEPTAAEAQIAERQRLIADAPARDEFPRIQPRFDAVAQFTSSGAFHFGLAAPEIILQLVSSRALPEHLSFP